MDRKAILAKWLDSNCTCNLKLGLSAKFSSMMKSSSVTTDPIDCIFQDKHEQQILKKRTQGMKDNYPDVEDGSKKVITCYPSGFTLDSRIKNSILL